LVVCVFGAILVVHDLPKFVDGDSRLCKTGKNEITIRVEIQKSVELLLPFREERCLYINAFGVDGGPMQTGAAVVEKESRKMYLPNDARGVLVGVKLENNQHETSPCDVRFCSVVVRST
jgi:hypothetical protein